MRLKEARIHLISENIIHTAVKKKYVQVKENDYNAMNEIARLIINDFQMEDKIDREVKSAIRRMKDAPPEGSSKYQAMFKQLKLQTAQRYNYIL